MSRAGRPPGGRARASSSNGTALLAGTDIDAAVAERRLFRQVGADLRWAFRPPWNWLAGVVINVVLAALWLFVEPLRSGPHRHWAVLIGTYFVVWVLADVTTTNTLGADARRVSARLRHNIRLRRILLVKNLTLLIIVGVPTMIATAAIAVATQRGVTVVFTVLAIMFPVLTWLGVGNLVSVALPVATLPLAQRWKQRRDLRHTGRWAAALALPYLIYLLVSPISALPRVIDSRTMLHIRGLPARSLTMAVTGLVLWALGTALALAVSRRRPVRFDELPPMAPRQPLRVTVIMIVHDVVAWWRSRRGRTAPRSHEPHRGQ